MTSVYSQFLLPYEGYSMFSQNSMFDYVTTLYAYTLNNCFGEPYISLFEYIVYVHITYRISKSNMKDM